MSTSPVWQAALDGNPPDWHAFFADYAAAVDWPASAFWPELADAFPDALILLSTRTDGDDLVAECRRHDHGAVCATRSRPRHGGRWPRDLWRRTLCPSWDDPVANAAAYERWVDARAPDRSARSAGRVAGHARAGSRCARRSDVRRPR